MKLGFTYKVHDSGLRAEGNVLAPRFEAIVNPGVHDGDATRIRIFISSFADGSQDAVLTMDVSDFEAMISVCRDKIGGAI